MTHPRGTRALLAAVLVAVALGATAMNGSVAAAAPAAPQAEIVADPNEGDPPDTADGPTSPSTRPAPRTARP